MHLLIAMIVYMTIVLGSFGLIVILSDLISDILGGK